MGNRDTNITEEYISKYDAMTIQEIEKVKADLLLQFETSLQEFKKENVNKKLQIETSNKVDKEIDIINVFYLLKLKKYITELEDKLKTKNALESLNSDKMILDKLFVIVEKTDGGIWIYNGEVYFTKENAEAEKPSGTEDKRYSVETLGYFLALDTYLRTL